MVEYKMNIKKIWKGHNDETNRWCDNTLHAQRETLELKK